MSKKAPLEKVAQSVARTGFNPIIGQASVRPHRSMFAVEVTLTQYVMNEFDAQGLKNSLDEALLHTGDR